MASAIETRSSSPASATQSLSLFGKLQKIVRPFASLQLTVALFAASIILVFFGTLAQKNSGIWTVVDQYFWSEIVWIDFQLMIQFGQIFFNFPTDWHLSGSFPFIGGRLLGFLMFINLLAAHATRFKLSWKRSGIFILHGGILLLFIGEFITREFQVEQQMVINEGESTNYTVDTRNFELALISPDGPDHQRVVTVPIKKLKQALADHSRISHDELPVDLDVVQYLVNSRMVSASEMKGENPATEGLGKTRGVQPASEISGVDMSKEIDVPSAYVRLYKKGSDESLGTYLVSLWLDEQKVTGLDDTEIVLRRTHYYKPYSLYLIDFRFDRYVGTQTPKNYSSQIRLVDPERGQDREVLISMNNPLRYRGETFFQADFDKRTEKTTVLHVVRNPGWLLPYLSCILVTLGMCVHFAIGMASFIRRTGSEKSVGPGVKERMGVLLARVLFSRQASAPPTTAVQRWLPRGMLALAVLFLGSAMTPRRPNGALDLREVARLPVVDGGRVKPLDTVARVNLRMINHREQFYAPDDKDHSTPLPAIKWFMDAASAPERDPGVASKYEIFRIENHQVLDLLGLKPREGLRYSLDEMRPKFEAFDEAAKKASARPEKDRDLFEAKVLELRRHVEAFLSAWQGHSPLLLPPAGELEWRNPAQVREQAIEQARPMIQEQLRQAGLPLEFMQMSEEQKQKAISIIEDSFAKARNADPGNAAWQQVLSAYRSGEQARLNEAVREFRTKHEAALKPEKFRKVNFETYLNETGLFYQLDYLYLMVFLLTIAGWTSRVFDIGLAEAFRLAAFYMLIPTLLAHTFTLFGRMYLMDRPLVFVTNLYSSAVFIGWASVALCLLIEKLFPLGVGNWVASVVGGGTCIIAHNLATSSDTLEMMQAVLDTNFWLATHVTTVTLGYSATYVAGLIGLLYVVFGLATPALKKPFALGATSKPQTIDVGRAVGMVLYGVICFATLLSFVGTVLGGIWADQSWGRFWGWDPKENGAVLIVTWNALILHARWAGLVKDRGMAILALVGNMITTWSWFGTNQLGVGLHAYGFNNTLATGCMYTWVSHILLIFIALAIPRHMWRSFAPDTSK